MYTLPLEVGFFQVLPKDAEIDMSVLNFPTDENLQKKSAFIFIRNTEIVAKFNFDNCTFEDKSEYLMLFMKTNARVRIPELITTWIKIIGYGYVEIPLKSILSDDDIERFIIENMDFVKEVRRFSVSIPLISINYFLKVAKIDHIDDIPKTDFNEMSIVNFFQLTDYEIFKEIINMIDIEPAFYTYYFDQKKSYYHELVNRFPYLNMLNMVMNSDTSMIEDFVSNMNKVLDGENKQ